MKFRPVYQLLPSTLANSISVSHIIMHSQLVLELEFIGGQGPILNFFSYHFIITFLVYFVGSLAEAIEILSKYRRSQKLGGYHTSIAL
jgi:hypothetical protein